MLKINNLHANIGDKEILKGLSLEINPGEVHAIMGPNGAGKSTLSSVLVGHPSFEVTEGEIEFEGESILDLEPEERAHLGMFINCRTHEVYHAYSGYFYWILEAKEHT